MRAVPIAVAILALCAVSAHAEDMVNTNMSAIMCRNEKALADFSGNDGSEKPGIMRDPFSATAKMFMSACKNTGGITVHVVSKRNNTSIVTYNGETWYVANVAFMTPTPDCIREGANVTLTGKIETGFHRTDEEDPKKGFRYPRLTLDQPVCYVGNMSEKAGRYVSLVGTSSAAYAALMKMIGRHATVSGSIGSPDNGNQPPDPMMIFDPAVKAAP